MGGIFDDYVSPIAQQLGRNVRDFAFAPTYDPSAPDPTRPQAVLNPYPQNLQPPQPPPNWFRGQGAPVAPPSSGSGAASAPLAPGYGASVHPQAPAQSAPQVQWDDEQPQAQQVQWDDAPSSVGDTLSQVTGIRAPGVGESGVGAWLRGAQSDIENGGSTTMVGRALRFLGAQGINNGTTPATAGQIMGPLIGPFKAAEGISNMGQHPVQGALQAVGGALQTASPALAFMSPEAGEIPGAISGANKMAAAGKMLSQVESRAGKVPLNIETLNQVAADTKELAQSGGQMPKVVRDFMRRVSNPDNGPLTLAQARKFYTNATRLSSGEFQNLTPVMQRQVGTFTKTLNQAITEAAGQTGMADQYINALKTYAAGAQQGKRVASAMNLAKQAAKTTALGAAGYEGYKIAQGK